MCIPPSSISVAAAAQHQNSLYYTQQSHLKQLQAQYPSILDIQNQFSNGGISSIDACTLLLHATNSIPSLTQQIAMPHSLEPTYYSQLTEVPAESRVDTSKHFNVFVGDLSKDVTSELLQQTFQRYGEISEAKVIRDPQTQKSKGYGFVSFPLKLHAESAIAGMNGKWIGKRAVRTNWASRKSKDEVRDKLTFEQVFNSTKADNTSVYVGNIGPNMTDVNLRESFASFGEILEVRIFKSQRYAFVRYDKKECATKAIMEMNGKEVGGTAIRCSWGRSQPVSDQTLQAMPIDFSSMMIPTLMSSSQIPLIQSSPFLNFEPTTLYNVYNGLPQW